ncbi:hypothetical protein EMCG_07580 [[Emmonsia] crescens]|uniref:Uncharacterized protein n=1 Tax=[Emmonsia] crescens TaxID=73230 RepID=A0A0G2J5H6_9EURO|nr:hypothetical protein EMCG_07580 [Emmonsia crescens UAMH 3008]
MDIDQNDSSDIEWSHVEDIDEEMPDATSANYSDNNDPYSRDIADTSDDDSLMADAVDGHNAPGDSGYDAGSDSFVPPLASGHVPVPTSSPMQVQPTILIPVGGTSSPVFVSRSRVNTCYQTASASPGLSRPKLYHLPRLQMTVAQHDAHVASQHTFGCSFSTPNKSLPAQHLTTAVLGQGCTTIPLSLDNYPIPLDDHDARKCPQTPITSPASKPASTLLPINK